MKKSSSAYLKFFTALIYCTALISVHFIVFAAIDRLIVIIYALFYRSHNMIKISKYICIFIWMFVFSLMFYKMFYTFSDNCLYYYLASIPSTCMDDIFSFVIGLIIFGTFLLLFLSILTVFLLRKNNLKTKIIRLNARQKKVYKTEIKLAKNLIVIVFAFFMMVSPLLFCFYMFFIHETYTVFGKSYQNNYAFLLLFHISYILFICGTIWDFVVYVWRTKNYRTGLTKLVRKN